MSHWGVEIVIGRLLTDDAFRHRFEQCGREWLTSIGEHGIDLDDAEIAALTEADSRIWRQMASRIDRRLHRHGSGADALATLTAREQRVLRGVFEGLTNKQIAADVGSTEPAVKATMQQLFRKARVRTRAQLVRMAVQGSGLTISAEQGRR
jgi:DNA-binding NarL/FixJ family response regulator